MGNRASDAPLVLIDYWIPVQRSMHANSVAVWPVQYLGVFRASC